MMSSEERIQKPKGLTAQRISRKSSVREQGKRNFTLKELKNDDMVHLLCGLEAEVQARDLIISALMKGNIGMALPLSHLLTDDELAVFSKRNNMTEDDEDDDDIWLGEATAHLNHVVAYHQLVREQMQSMLDSLQQQHKVVVRQLEDEQHKHALDTAQGDDVTYMLEKERERLTNQIEFEVGKQRKCEKEKEKLVIALDDEKQRHELEFSELMTDYKYFATQLIDQAQREEQLIKELDKEKSKNRILSELVISEQKKYKEKLQFYEGDRLSFQQIEQQKQEIETKLCDSEKQFKEVHQKYVHESQRVRKLEMELNRLKASTVHGRKYSSGSSENSDEMGDILVDSHEPKLRQAKQALVQNLSVNTDRNSSTGSPEPQLAPPQQAQQLNPICKVATVQKSNLVKQNKGTVSRTKPPSQAKSNTIGGRSSTTKESKQNNPLKTVVSPNESKKLPPPTPPRISSITAKSVPVPPDIRSTRSNSLGANINDGLIFQNALSSENRSGGSSPNRDSVNITLAVVTGYGWNYTREAGLKETNQLVDILGEINVFPDYDWQILTQEMNDIFVEQASLRLWSSGQESTDEGRHHVLQISQSELTSNSISHNSISHYEINGFMWSPSSMPDDARASPFATFLKINKNVDLCVAIHLKDYLSGCVDSLSYSSLLPTRLLEEYIRIVDAHKNVMFISQEELEGKYFALCFANWLKLVKESSGSSCIVANVERNAINNISDLIQCLTDYGILRTNADVVMQHLFILLVDVDFIIAENLSGGLFEWLCKRGQANKFNIPNGLSVSQQAVFLQEKLLVLGYGTQTSLMKLDQWVYRLFRVIELPPTMPYLLQKWLRQKAMLYTETGFNLSAAKCNQWCRYVSDMFIRVRTDLTKMEIIQELPDVSMFLAAPVENPNNMPEWIKSLWTDYICPLIEDVVFEQVVGASKSQQDLLRKVTLQTIYETAILPGCPVNLIG